MIHKIRVLRSALKDGHAESDIAYAWCNYEQDSKDHSRTDQSVHVRIGATPAGVMLEMIAAWDERDLEWRVFHAMRPKTGILHFMGLED